MAMSDKAYQDLLRQEQEEIALSIQYSAALDALRAKNEEAEKEILQLEQELLAVTTECETLQRFKDSSQDQCFSVKAKSYKINGKKQKAKQTLRDVDKLTAYWKDVYKNGEEAAKSLDKHVSNLYDSPWIVHKAEEKAEVDKSNEVLAELQKELSDLENSRKLKSPKNSLDTQTVEMFRNMVRSELRLNPQRVIEPLKKLDRSEPRPGNVATPPKRQQSNHDRRESTAAPPRSRLESTPTRKQKEVQSRVSSPPNSSAAPSRPERSGRLEFTPTRKTKEVPRRVSPPPASKMVESDNEATPSFLNESQLDNLEAGNGFSFFD